MAKTIKCNYRIQFYVTNRLGLFWESLAEKEGISVKEFIMARVQERPKEELGKDQKPNPTSMGVNEKEWMNHRLYHPRTTPTQSHLDSAIFEEWFQVYRKVRPDPRVPGEYQPDPNNCPRAMTVPSDLRHLLKPKTAEGGKKK